MFKKNKLQINKLCDKYPFVGGNHNSRYNKLPLIICYTEEQVIDFKFFVKSKAGVVGVDRTFCPGKCFVTTTLYKVQKATGEPPIIWGF
jgi:hypothetical protein